MKRKVKILLLLIRTKNIEHVHNGEKRYHTDRQTDRQSHFSPQMDRKR